MKLRYLVPGLLLLAMALPLPAAAEGEQVTDYTVKSTLTKEDVLDVQESLTYDLADAAAHPVNRDITLLYPDDQGRQYPVKFHLISFSQDGQNVSPDLTMSPSEAKIVLSPQPGKPNHFELHYTLTPVIVRGLKKDILKFTFTEMNLSVPVQQAGVTLVTPGLVLEDPACQTGAAGETSGHCRVTEQGDTVHVTTDTALGPGESLSMTGTFPRGSFTSYLGPQVSWASWLGFGVVLAVPIGALVLIIVFALRRARRGLP